MSRNPIRRVGSMLSEYPTQFWALTGATFVDNVGSWLLFPFFSLYVTEKFGVGLTQVGFVFALWSIAALFGSTIGGALSDRWGRKPMIIGGLITSALSSLTMIFIADLLLFYLVTLVVGFFSSFGAPAQQAIVADMLPEDQRADGYGLLRVALNVGAAVGPALGGLMAAKSFTYLFISDAVTSLITAMIVVLAIDETKPEPREGAAHETMRATFRGYVVPLRDTVFVLFMLASILASLVYMQLNSTLPVYLRDQHGLEPQYFGYLLTMNATMVILLQFPLTRRIRGYAPMLMMAVGVLFYAIGFGLFGVVTLFAGFVVATVILTIGEMIVVPVSQAIVAQLAPEEMRGRYMAVFSYVWLLPSTFGPLLAGIVMDNYSRNLVWYGSFLLCLISAAVYLALQRRVGSTSQAEHEPHKAPAD